MTTTCHCGKPLCPDCGQCPGEGHKPDCPSEEARAKMAALIARTLIAQELAKLPRAREVGGKDER